MSFIETLKQNISRLSPLQREILNRIFKITEIEGFLVPPKEMESWIKKHFGSVDIVKSQKIVKITNLVTFEGTIFNDLRGKRPKEEKRKPEELKGEKTFSEPLKFTPEDTFGRVEGKYCLTASNVAKYDSFHSLLIFKEPNPLDFSPEKIVDYFATAKNWFKKAHQENPKAVYPFFMWNCLWRAGASITHGHAQITLGKEIPYSKIEFLKGQSLLYQEKFGQNYFGDLYKIHNALGLGREIVDLKVIASLTPIKNWELWLLCNLFDKNLAFLVSKILNIYKKRLGVESFNLAIYLPPLEKTKESFEHMPVIVRLLDRGALEEKTSDIGAMELFAQSVVSFNPYTLMSVLTREM